MEERGACQPLRVLKEDGGCAEPRPCHGCSSVAALCCRVPTGSTLPVALRHSHTHPPPHPVVAACDLPLTHRDGPRRTSQQQCGHVVPHAGVVAHHATRTMAHAGQCRVTSPCATPLETANARELRWWGRRGVFTLLSTRYFWVACTRGWPSTPTFYSEVRMPRHALLYFHPLPKRWPRALLRYFLLYFE